MLLKIRTVSGAKIKLIFHSENLPGSFFVTAAVIITNVNRDNTY